MIDSAFETTIDESTIVVIPTRNITSLAENDVKADWDEVLQSMNEAGVRHVIFDFEKISYFGSSMLEAMLYLWKQIRPQDGKLAVCNVSKTAKEILRLSKFDTIWPVCGTREDAQHEVDK
ncbi:MAG: STAS domain-containing protein [Euryarchaeota archaeon]|nr:STAS domain-containing protein [Euryarchaeota archaeon]